jgi:hypothetical protein
MIPICVYERVIPEEDKDYTYTDEDITFVMHVYKDGQLADWSLGNLRKCYPKSRVLVIADGDPDPLLDTFAEKHGVEFQRTDRLMLLETGVAYLMNRMEQFLKKPTKYMIKIDPDTGFHRRFKYIPNYDVFGCVLYAKETGPYTIRGGFYGFSGDAVKEIYESDIFSNPDLEIHEWFVKRQGDIKLLEEDTTMMEACFLMGMDMGPFPEVFVAQIYKPNRKLRFAVTHPCRGYKL